MRPDQAIGSGIQNYTQKYADKGAEGIKKILEICQHFKDRSSQILNDKTIIKHLDSKTTHFVKVLHWEVDGCLYFSGHKGYLLAQVSFLYGIQTSLPNLTWPRFWKPTIWKVIEKLGCFIDNTYLYLVEN